MTDDIDKLSEDPGSDDLENLDGEALDEEDSDKENLMVKLVAFSNSVLNPILNFLDNYWVHILNIIGILLLSTFIYFFVKLRRAQETEKLIGYVRLHHRVPKWFEGEELPKAAQEHLDNYKAKQKKLEESYKVVKKNKYEGRPVLAAREAPPLNNIELVKILREQSLGRVTKSGVEKPENMDLSGYKLNKLDFKYFKDFISADMRYTDFSNIEVQELSFRGSSLAYAIFAESSLPKSNFIRTFLSFANFYHTVLDYSSFVGVQARKVYFYKASMTATNFTDSRILDSDFSETNLDEAIFKNSYVLGTNFNNSSLRKANFRNAQLQGSSFINTDLEGVNFENANLEGVDFTGANLLGTIFDNADVTQAKFRGAKNATFKQLSEVKFLLSARSIPDDLIPKKKSWLERFKAPHEHAGLRSRLR